MKFEKISENESLNIQGGRGGGFWSTLAGSAINNWDQIKDGYNKGKDEDVLGGITPK
ncbi:hypothetical protein P1A28_13385 [Staphylococcus equorum]|uniref:hypothetical protein n=1 Tax=Staphylococcus equorum TaxID=246432 RepID=UPI00255307F3|nr:hypothetical protein [Staphylococcus equorum]MDK9844677.1 hypothetical protein [Staphylococcus equorum]